MQATIVEPLLIIVAANELSPNKTAINSAPRLGKLGERSQSPLIFGSANIYNYKFAM
jgi:hypothetical protein